jgi:hypothetical protein
MIYTFKLTRKDDVINYSSIYDIITGLDTDSRKWFILTGCVPVMHTNKQFLPTYTDKERPSDLCQGFQ